MALQLGALRSALISAGASQEEADKAAEELAGYETRFLKIDTDLSVLKWMVGFNLAVSVASLFKLFH
jgi:hypothetical protein